MKWFKYDYFLFLYIKIGEQNFLKIDSLHSRVLENVKSYSLVIYASFGL